MKTTKSVGAILINPDGKVAIVSNRGRSWTFPKGHMEEGETKLETLEREVQEETGITDFMSLKEFEEYTRPRISVDLTDDQSELKQITLFLCITDETTLKPEDPENPEAKWVDPNHVSEYLTHQKDREFYELVKTEITGIAAIGHNDFKDALDTMAFNDKIAQRHPETQKDFQEDGMYDYDPNSYEESYKFFEEYGYHYNMSLWKLHQLKYRIAGEQSDRL
jgi:bis(5'-nucleosidyl)-tetraphosphatase